MSHARAGQDRPTYALQGVTMSARPGEMVSVVGPSGSGKSSLLYALSGFLRPHRGDAHLLGTDLTGASQTAVARLHRQGVGFVFQSLNLVPSMPVVENVMLPARFAGFQDNPLHALDILSRLGLGDRGDQRTSELSGGQQQRVAMARVIYSKPHVVMADEPTGALDSHTGQVVLSCLRDVANRGATVLLVTHDLSAASLADRALVLADGRLVQEIVDPNPAELLAAQGISATGVRPDLAMAGEIRRSAHV